MCVFSALMLLHSLITIRGEQYCILSVCRGWLGWCEVCVWRAPYIPVPQLITIRGEECHIVCV